MFFSTGVPPDGADDEQRSGTVLLEDVDLNEKKNSSPRSSRFREDRLTFDRKEKKTSFEGKIIRRRVGVRFPA